METNLNKEDFDEKQSFEIIQEMIQVSQKKLKNNGILFIIWGWLMLYNYLSMYILNTMITTYNFRHLLKIFDIILALAGISFSIYYIIKQSRKAQTYIGISLRYVWFGLFICMSLTNMIIFNVNHQMNFALQHPIFMTFIAFATVITGGIIRYRLVIFGGIIFGILAYISSFFALETQLLLEASAWVIAFIIPGHILFSKRNK